MSGQAVEILGAEVPGILHNANLHIAEGDFLALIGPNGAGKTTLLRLINGLIHPRTGTVAIFGENFTGRTANRLRSGIGYVAQRQSFDRTAPVSVRQAVAIGRYARAGILRGLSRGDHAAIDRALDETGLADLADRPVGRLSGGEQQKLAIARALAQEPRIILLDEPTSNLDLRSQQDVLGLIQRIPRAGRFTVVFVTHVLDHIPRACTAAALMKNGRVERSGPPERVLRADILSRLYDCHIEVSEADGRRHFHAATGHV